MINVFYNTINTVTFYLKPSLTNPVYLISLVNYTERVRINFISSELSNGSNLLQFFLEEVGEDPENLLDNKISIPNFGRYTAELYEQNSATNLDQSLATLLGSDELIAHKEPVYDNPPERNEIIAPVSICDLFITASANPESSLGANDGYASVIVSGDVGTLTFAWTGDGGYTSSLQNITGLTPGDYTITVSDDVNILCSVSKNVTVDEGEIIPNCDIEISGIVTVGTTGTSGAATATVIGNNGIVNYKWNGPNGYTSSSNPATGIEQGEISLAVSDSGVGVTCIDSDCATVPVTNGNAISFKGDGDHITFTPVNFTAGSDSTVQFQFYADSVSSQQVLMQGDNLVSPEVITILNSGAFLIRLNSTSKVFDVPTMSANTWNTFHQTIVDGILRVYINGVESEDSFDSVFEWDFRHINDGQGIGLEFKGLMDNICMDNTHGASIAEIVQMVANPSEFKNIIGSANRVYNCNQTGAQTTLTDTSGNNEAGTMDGLIAEPFVPHV